MRRPRRSAAGAERSSPVRTAGFSRSAELGTLPGVTAPAPRTAEELQQRDSARELGAGLVLAIYRLAKVATLHSLDNMAVHQAIDQALETIRLFQARTGARMSMLFAKSTVFIAGQLMKGSRADYESALELGQMIKRFGYSEIVLRPEVSAGDLREFLSVFMEALRGGDSSALRRPAPSIRLRRVNPAVLNEDEGALSEEERVVRAYASAIVVMRRVFENLSVGRYELPHEAKRIAQKLVRLSEGDTPAFLGVTAMRNQNQDAAGRAVNTSILAVSMARQLTDEIAVLAKIAMAALLFDVAKPYVLDLPPPEDDRPLIVPRLLEEDLARLPAATALVLTTLGQLHHASQIRSVIAYEAHWQRAGLGPLYGGARTASVAARIVSSAHRFNELLTPDPGASSFATPDEAVSTMNDECSDDVERAIVALLVGAIGMFPTGSLVELTTGELGVVVSTPHHPADYARPVVRVVYDSAQRVVAPFDVDCVHDATREVKQVLRRAEPELLAVREAVLAERHAAAIERVPASRRSGRPERISTAAPPPRGWADSLPAGGDIATRRPGAPSGEHPRVASIPAARAPVGVSDAPPRPVSSKPPLPKRGARPTAEAVDRSEFDTVPPPPDYDELAAESMRPGTLASRTDLAEANDDGTPRPEPEPILDPADATPVPVPAVAQTTASQAVEAADDAPSSIVPDSDDAPPATRGPAIVSVATLPREAAGTDGAVSSGRVARPAPTAYGDLLRAPPQFQLVYNIDKKLTGTILFTEANGAEHGLYFASGDVRRASSTGRVAPLGPLLIAMGALDPSDLNEGGDLAPVAEREALLESALLASGRVDPDDLAAAVDEQLAQRVAAIFTLPPETEYAFYADVNLLKGLCADTQATLGALAVLMAGVRAMRSAEVVTSALGRLEGKLLAVHPEAPLDAFGFDDAEKAVVAEIAAQSPPISALLATHSEAAARSAVYALQITRCLATGKGAGPVQPPT